MMLENLKRKIEADKKAKADSPYKRVTIIPLGNGKVKTVSEPISLREWMEDQADYEDNSEDLGFRAEMEDEDA